MVNKLFIFARRHQVFAKYYLCCKVAEADYALGTDQSDMMEKPRFQGGPVLFVNSAIKRKRLNNGGRIGLSRIAADCGQHFDQKLLIV